MPQLFFKHSSTMCSMTFLNLFVFVYLDDILICYRNLTEHKVMKKLPHTLPWHWNVLQVLLDLAPAEQRKLQALTMALESTLGQQCFADQSRKQLDKHNRQEGERDGCCWSDWALWQLMGSPSGLGEEEGRQLGVLCKLSPSQCDRKEGLLFTPADRWCSGLHCQFHRFSYLNLRSGYWQVELAPEAKPKASFTIGQGLSQFRVMPFGLCNGVPGTHAWLGAHGSVAAGQTLTISPTCLTCCWGKGCQLHLMSWSEWLLLRWPQSACSPKAGQQTFETLCVGWWGCQGQLTPSGGGCVVG